MNGGFDMKSLREQFEMDYAPVPYTAKPGGKVKIRYAYDGPWYFWELPREVLKKKKWTLTCMSIAVFVLFIMSALIPCGVNVWTVTAVAGVCGLAAHVLELFGIIRFLSAKAYTTRMNYSYVNGIMTIVPWLHGICLLGAFLSGVAYMAKNSVNMPNIAASAGYLVCAVLCFIIAASYQKIPFGTCKNQTVTDRKKKA